MGKKRSCAPARWLESKGGGVVSGGGRVHDPELPSGTAFGMGVGGRMGFGTAKDQRGFEEQYYHYMRGDRDFQSTRPRAFANVPSAISQPLTMTNACSD